MNKRNIKIALAVVLVLALSFFWGEFDLFSNKGMPEVDDNIVIQKTREDEDSQVLEDFTSQAREEDEELEDQEEPEEVLEEDEELEEEREDESKSSVDLEFKEENKKEAQAEKDSDKKETEKKPAETKPAIASPASLEMDTVSLRVDASTLIKNRSKLDKNKQGLVPKSGLIYVNDSAELKEGDTVFDLLLREMRQANIHLESSMTPMYRTNYVEGINNIYEFDAGELSGWMYKVNGEFPSYGASEVKLKPGDVVEWVYTCDLGKDIGGKNSTGGRR